MSAGEASDVDVMDDVDVFAAAMDDFGADFNINARLLIPVVRTAISDRS